MKKNKNASIRTKASAEHHHHQVTTMRCPTTYKYIYISMFGNKQQGKPLTLPATAAAAAAHENRLSPLLRLLLLLLLMLLWRLTLLMLLLLLLLYSVLLPLNTIFKYMFGRIACVWALASTSTAVRKALSLYIYMSAQSWCTAIFYAIQQTLYSHRTISGNVEVTQFRGK